jgi:hypothetical protein
MALLLVACALVFRIAVPAGWMPRASTAGITLSWCNDSGMSGPKALAEAKALLAAAIGGKSGPAHQSGLDEPCAFAAAAQPMTSADPVPAPQLRPAHEPLRFAPIALLPGRGLAAPPPRSTGPPLLA